MRKLSGLFYSALLGAGHAYDVNDWVSAPQGGYTRGTCDCEIRCSSETIDETCGADVVVGVDMQNFDKDKKEMVEELLGHISDQLNVELTFDQNNTNSARMSLFGFTDQSNDIKNPINFKQFEDPTLDYLNVLKESFGEAVNPTDSMIDFWSYVGSKSEMGHGLQFALNSFSTPRTKEIRSNLELFGFEHTKLIVLITDGKNNERNNALQQMRIKIDKQNIKIVVITLSEIDSPSCKTEKAACPDIEDLTRIGDKVIDGKAGADAARQVMDIIMGNKCKFDGGCKPCNCECAFPRGPAGPVAEMGCDGAPGACGPNGMDGMAGLEGIMGRDGVVGAKGECGPCGIPGLPGSAGEPGPDGLDALDGNPGIQGPQGPIGPLGDKGLIGIKGFDGVEGPDGFQGPQGLTGPKGVKGGPGVSGDVILNVSDDGSSHPKSQRPFNIRRRSTRELREADSSFFMDEDLFQLDRQQRETIPNAINAASQADRDFMKNKERDEGERLRLQGEATAQFYERFHTNEDKWNEYLTNYYNETEIHILSKSIRGLIQDWMQENKDVINCILNCNDCGAGDGDGNEDAAGKSAMEEMAPAEPLKCEEPVDVVFLVDGSDSITARDWPLVLKWTNNLIEKISPQDREYASSAIFQQFSKDPLTGDIPDPIIGKFIPGDLSSVEDFKAQVSAIRQSAQGTNTYECLNKVFGQDGLFYQIPSVADPGPEGGATVFITLSDGDSRDRATERRQENVDKLKKLSRMQIAVGIGEQYNKLELTDFAQDDSHILHYDDFGQLVEAGQQIITLIQEGCKSQGSRNADIGAANTLETSTENRYESSDSERYWSDKNSYDSSKTIDLSDAQEIDIDFLDWPYYNRNDKRHRHK